MIVLISMHNIMAMKKEEPKQEVRISQPDGKTLIFIQGDEPHTWEVLRFNPDNSPDSSFGFNGKMAHMGDEFESILTPIAAEIESDGNILLTYSEKDKKGSESFFQSRINPEGRYVFFKRGIISVPMRAQKIP
jgi:hypothetical protein